MTLTTNRCSVEKAGIRALKRHLDRCFAEDGEFWAGNPVVVQDWWPTEAELPPFLVSIITAGDRKDERLQAQQVNAVLDDTTGVYTWAVAVCTQAIQLDVWSTTDVGRSSLVASLDDYLRRGDRYTLNNPSGDPTRDGLLLALNPNDGHTGFADIEFSGPSPTDTADAAQRAEFRTLYRGEVNVELTVKSTEFRHLRTLVDMHLGDAEPHPLFALELT
jgi:hypothetical protein